MMEKAVFFWDYFKATGNIGAYLLYKELIKSDMLSEYSNAPHTRGNSG
jgi:hypothetical protein